MRERRLGSREVAFWVGDDGALRVEHVPHPFLPRWLSGLAGEMVGGEREPYVVVMPATDYAGHNNEHEEFHFGLGELMDAIHGSAVQRRHGTARGQEEMVNAERYEKMLRARADSDHRKRSLLLLAAAQLGIERLANGRLPNGERAKVEAHARSIRFSENDERWRTICERNERSGG